MSAYKVLSLWQPWASLVALGVKNIETRSWSTSYRGPLAIHAGTRGLPLGGVCLPRTRIRRPGETWEELDEDNGQAWLAIDTITDPEFQGDQPVSPRTGRQRRIPKRAQAPTLFWPHRGPWHRPREGSPEFTHTEYLPLGAIVATCTLADVAPMVDQCGTDMSAPAHLCIIGEYLTLHRPEDDPFPNGETERPVSGQLPYGDFSPGRWAWLLEDVKPLPEPVPFKGGQGLSRTWTA